MAQEVSFPGIASGIDFQGLASALKAQIQTPNAITQQSIDTNTKESSSLEQLRQKLLDVGSKLDSLRSTNDGGTVFETDSSDTSKVVAAADSSAQAGSFTVQVQSLAANGVGTFDRSFGSTDDSIVGDSGASGDVQFTIGTGDSAHTFAIGVDSTTTAADFVTRFNDLAGGNAQASLVNIGSTDAPDLRISFAANGLGTAAGSIAVSASDPGLLGASGLNGTTISQATDAVFSVSGLTGSFTRPSNTITDAVAGVSLQLKAPGTSTITVADSGNNTADQLESFVKSFNSLVTFANGQNHVTTTKVDGDSVNLFGSLSQTSVDDDAVSAIRDSLSDTGAVSLASLGVTTQRDGTLAFDRSIFDKTYAANPADSKAAITKVADAVSGVGGAVYNSTAYGLGIDLALKSNAADNDRLNSTIDKVDRRASAAEETALTQFSKIDALISQLQSSSGYLSSLLQF